MDQEQPSKLGSTKTSRFTRRRTRSAIVWRKPEQTLSMRAVEPPRLFCRLHSLRGWSHEQQDEVFTEVRERAVQMVLEHQGEHASQRAVTPTYVYGERASAANAPGPVRSKIIREQAHSHKSEFCRSGLPALFEGNAWRKSATAGFRFLFFLWSSECFRWVSMPAVYRRQTGLAEAA